MKTAIVTGASGAIGGAIAKKLAAEGYAVVLCANKNIAKAEALKAEIVAAGGEACCFAADLSSFAAAKSLVAEAVKIYGRVDALVAAAGISKRGLFIDENDESFAEIIGANLTSFASISAAAIPEMMKRGEGSVLAIGSIWGSVGASMEAAYSATKAGVAGLVKALAKEYAPSGIRVNCLSPGAIDTPMNAFLSPEERAELESEIPLGRFGTPEEVAEMACAMLQNRYLTGRELVLDGGMVL